ncbi:murein transglycosylase [Palleronia sediminis]|uniref:peptidoglycan lytic exotransglycosylase n=1 Tax=Palleronia sediminis TaxID=2547833 RepID=A0A4R6A3V6_9RHOB|nr:MltA domain-containing protein [Palleronia sediminis]TDL78331.1 murein transglycosylase [Palleronia sediminis]
MRYLVAVLALLAATAGPLRAGTVHDVLDWSEIDGWSQDDLDEAMRVFLETCGDLRDPDWRAVCRVGKTGAAEGLDGDTYFRAFFRPVLIEDGAEMLFTGYYEPELRGSRVQTPFYRYPLYRLPPEAAEGSFASRAEIEELGLLDGRGLEIAWLSDPVDVYFLQVQGSGRIRLTDGTALRVGYAGKNGHSYRSVGKELIRRGDMEPHKVSASAIRQWVRERGDEGRRALHHNPSYVFFREVNEVPWSRGPLGAMNRSLTAMRSVAIDPDIVKLGAPVWIEKDGAEPMRRLMVAQDTGAAIKGAQRADIFFGTGESAGRKAGTIRDGGRMVVLLPIQRAYSLATGL